MHSIWVNEWYVDNENEHVDPGSALGNEVEIPTIRCRALSLLEYSNGSYHVEYNKMEITSNEFKSTASLSFSATVQ